MVQHSERSGRRESRDRDYSHGTEQSFYINATAGFDKLASVTKKSPKSLMRMLGPTGNPQARNFFEIVAYLQKRRRALESATGVESVRPRASSWC
jgi:hypothetical protein